MLQIGNAQGFTDTDNPHHTEPGGISRQKGLRMKNDIHDKIFTCPKCGNKALVPVCGNEDVVGIGYHELCICDECGAELYSEPQFDFTVKFIEMEE